MSSLMDSFTIPIEVDSLEISLNLNKDNLNSSIGSTEFNGFDWEGSSGSHSPDLTFTPSTTESPEDSDNPEQDPFSSFLEIPSRLSERFLPEELSGFEGMDDTFKVEYPVGAGEKVEKLNLGVELDLIDMRIELVVEDEMINFEAALETFKALETFDAGEKNDGFLEAGMEEIYDGEETEDEDLTGFMGAQAEIVEVQQMSPIDPSNLLPNLLPVEAKPIQVLEAPIQILELEPEEEEWNDDDEDEETYYLDPNNEATYIPLPTLPLLLPFLPPLPTSNKRDLEIYSSPVQSTSRLTFNDEAYQDDEEYRDSNFGTRSSTSSHSQGSTRRKSTYSEMDSGSSNSLTKRKTETLAVEDDPSVKPYGCSYPSCVVINEEREKKGKARELEEEEEYNEYGFENKFRTIRGLRDHCAIHKKAGERGGDTPFRCSLEPCNKTFKSLAGLHTHFLNASANGHFLLSYSDGEDRPSKKLKKSVSMESSSRRSEKCPVDGCLKAFKQSAGLAYHIAHSDNHTNFITEEMMTTFSGTLVSKVRWWFKKKNIVIADS